MIGRAKTDHAAQVTRTAIQSAHNCLLIKSPYSNSSDISVPRLPLRSFLSPGLPAFESTPAGTVPSVVLGTICPVIPGRAFFGFFSVATDGLLSLSPGTLAACGTGAGSCVGVGWGAGGEAGCGVGADGDATGGAGTG